MRALPLAVFALALSPLPVTAEPDAGHAAANIAFLEHLTGIPRSDAPMTLRVNSEDVRLTVAEAYALLGELTAHVDLAGVTAHATTGLLQPGDVLFFGRDCAFVSGGTQPFFIPVHWQFWIWPGQGHVGTCGPTSVYGSTLKAFEHYPSARIAGTGTILRFFDLTLGGLNGVVAS